VETRLLEDGLALLFLSALFLAGILYEIKAAKHRFFVLPPAYFSLYMLLSLFLPGIHYYYFDAKAGAQFMVSDYYVNLGAWYTLVAVQVLWIAFYALPAVSYRSFSKFEINSVPIWLIHLFVIISVASFFIGLSTGTFGYVANPENVGMLGFVRLGINFGLLAIILLTIYHTHLTWSRRYLYAVIAINMAIGLAFGSKSTVVSPIIIYILSLYMSGRQIGKASLVSTVVAIALAYTLVEPFRIYYDLFASGRQLSISELIEAFVSAREYIKGDEANYIVAFLDRMNYLTVLGRTIEYADLNNYYRSEEWGHLLLSPLYGVVPRFIWESKPLADFGLWTSVNIFDLPATTHTGITPQGYSYLVMRLPGVILLFTLYGLIQKTTFNMFFLNGRLIPVYLYFYYIVIFPSYPTWTAISSFVQTLVLTIFLLALFKPYQKSAISPKYAP